MSSVVHTLPIAPLRTNFHMSARTILLLFFLWMPFYIGCSSSNGISDSTDTSTSDSTNLEVGTDPNTEKLCDASNEIRLYFRSKPLWGTMGEFANVYYENGFSYFVVDGHCRYWAFDGFDKGGPYGRWNDVWSGELNEQEAATLSAEVRWGGLEALTGHSTNRDVDHGGVWQITDGRTGMLSCETECPDEENQSVIAAGQKWLEWMLDHGEPTDHSFRGIIALMPEEKTGTHFSTIELPEELEPFVVDEPSYFGFAACPGETIEFPPEVYDLIKGLRQEYRDGEHGFFRDLIPMVNDDGRIIQMHIRPGIEPEDERGLFNFGFGSPDEEIINSGNPCPSGNQ